MIKKINLEIRLHHSVAGILYGLQKGKGAGYETVQAQMGNGQDLKFQCTLEAKEGDRSVLTLTGPFVQGPPGNRFLYLVIGSYAGQKEAAWSGRMKVPVPELTFQQQGIPDGTHCWHCIVPGRTESGKPFFATVKPFAGWFPTSDADLKST